MEKKPYSNEVIEPLADLNKSTETINNTLAEDNPKLGNSICPAPGINGATGSVVETTVTIVRKPVVALSDLERRFLGEAGIPASEIEELTHSVANRRAKSKAATKLNLSSLVATQAEAILAAYSGKTLFSAEIVGTYIISAGLHAPVTGFNAWGDACGKHGHHLPKMSYQGRCRYDLTMIGKAMEEKKARQEELLGLRPQVIGYLVAQLPAEQL